MKTDGILDDRGGSNEDDINSDVEDKTKEWESSLEWTPLRVIKRLQFLKIVNPDHTFDNEDKNYVYTWVLCRVQPGVCQPCPTQERLAPKPTT